MQHLLEHGSEADVSRLMQVLTAHAATVGAEVLGTQVLGKALCHGSPEAQVDLAPAILAAPGLIVIMASSHHGHIAVKQALLRAEATRRYDALANLMAQKQHPRASRYGRVLATFAEKLYLEMLN